MKRLFLLTLLVELVFVAALMLVRSVLQSAPMPTAVRMRSEIQWIAGMWCWHGVCPGETLISIAKTQVEAAGEDVLAQSEDGDPTTLPWENRTDPTWYGTMSSADEFIRGIHIDLSESDVRLGDVIAQLGTPSFTHTQIMLSRTKRGQSLGLATFICYEGGLCFTIETDRCDQKMRFDVHVPVRHMFFYPASRARIQFGVVSEWQSLTVWDMHCPQIIY